MQQTPVAQSSRMKREKKYEAGATAINPNWPPLNTDEKRRVWNFYLTVNAWAHTRLAWPENKKEL